MIRWIAVFFVIIAPCMAIAEEKSQNVPIWQEEVEQEQPTKPQEGNLTYNPSEEPADKKNLEDPDQIYYNPEEIKDRAPKNQEEGQAEVKPEDAAPVKELPKWVESEGGKVKILNKVLTRNKEFSIKKGKELKQGNLVVKMEKCFRQPESDRKESSALLLISQVFTSAPTKEIFHGWMFSSSPAISALEHPLYDVILLSCDEEAKEVKKDDAKDAKIDTKPKKK